MPINEKVELAKLLSNSPTSPGNTLNFTIIGSIVTSVAGAAAAVACGKKHLAPVPLLAILGMYEVKHRLTAPAPTQATYLTFKDAKTERKWKGRKMPVSIMVILYLEDKIDFTMDVLEALEHMDEFCCYMPSWHTIKFLLVQLLPFRFSTGDMLSGSSNSTSKDKETTKKEIEEHYNRGNDFFAAFLGPRMIYTSAVFENDDDTLESAQDNKMRKICDKLRLQPGDKVMDIGCGWGTLAGYMNNKYAANSFGVTLSSEGAKWCRDNNKAAEKGKDGKVEFMVTDYRDIPDDTKFDAISSVEMAEHVGLANFQTYLNKVKTNLKDDGAFYMQVAGLRRGSDWKDIMWGLFMGEYIFPGADASTPLNWYILQLEQAGLEVESIENVGIHYSLTLHEWYKNWMRNEPEISKKYAAPLCRLWRVFLAWSVLASRRGTATCWMITSHKMPDVFDRSKMITGAPKWAEAAKFAKFK
jgi:cyclopropane fatty-acyl-phospholipid synthase-like methyltransferase